MPWVIRAHACHWCHGRGIPTTDIPLFSCLFLLRAEKKHPNIGDMTSLQEIKAGMTPRDAAEALGVSEPTVYHWIKTKRLPAYRVGSHYRILRADLESFVVRTTSEAS
jgi:excisionase family DNA binding protein